MPINQEILNSRPTYPPHHLLPWLEYVQSLTQRLKQIAGDATLFVLNQGIEPADAWDNQVLGLTHQDVFHREITMSAWNEPCWYARTILPCETLYQHQALFDRLKTEPLGHLIFNGSEVKRLSIMHFKVDEQSCAYHFLTKELRQNETVFWARLSEFSVHDTHSFFLLEILLPGLARYCL